MRYRMVIGVLIVVLVQEAVVPQVKIAGEFPDVIAGYVAVAGLTGGPAAGAAVGFLAGLGEDLFLQEPFGMSALVYTMIGFAIGSLFSSTPVASSRFGTAATAAAGSAIAVLGYALVGALLGQTQMLTLQLGAAVGIVAAVNFVVGIPLARLARWSQSTGAVATAQRRALRS